MKYCCYCMMEIDENNIQCPFCGKIQHIELPEHHLIVNQVLNGRYVVGAVIGEGGFGITYIGHDQKLDMRVAIKEFYPKGYVNRLSDHVTIMSSTCVDQKAFFEKGKERFLNEARLLAKFSGEPGIVDVRDFFEENNTAYIVMEYLDGETLKEYLKKKGTLLPEHTIHLLMPVMLSLKKIHREGLIHRDISPDNIMLAGEQVKLLDFGAARNVANLSGKSLSVILKPGYAPVEQYSSKSEQGAFTDVYALCATMYKCITGFTPDDAAQRVYSDELKPPSALGISIDKTIENALMKGLSVLQNDRYQSIEDLLNGFKGINIHTDEDEKTVYHRDTVSTDEDETRYMGNADVTYKDVSQDFLSSDEIPEYKPSAAKTEKNWMPTEKKHQKSQSVSAPAHAQNAVNKSKKRLGVIVLAAALVVAAIVGITAIFKSLNNVTIAGEKIDKKSESINISGKTVTSEDVKVILSLGNLKAIRFSNCQFDNDTVKGIGNISTYFQTLSLDKCTGFDDYSFISNLRYLTSLKICNCNLTNDQLNLIDFSAKDYLYDVSLSGNESLSDISILSKLSNSLTILKVDNTSVNDFSSLESCKALSQIEANNTGLTTLSSIKNAAVTDLYVNDNRISDISQVSSFKALNNFEADNNCISDISALADHPALYSLSLNNNKINDVAALSTDTHLGRLELNNNNISSIHALSECRDLKYLCINKNNLSSFDGLQTVLELKVLRASDNKITDISGLTNSTILEEINLNNNNVSNISYLSKSAKTLKKLYINNNNVNDIAALQGTEKLEYLSFDNNTVTTLDSLKNSNSLLAVSAENNKITSVDGLSGASKLKYIYLPHNKIENIHAISNLQTEKNWNFAVIDLSSNNISKLDLPADKEYSYLAIYNNPIRSLDKLSGMKGNYLLFSYIDGMDLAGLNDAFTYVNVIDCPLDKQVSVKDAVKRRVIFSTVEEADQQTRSAKNAILTGSTEEDKE